MGECATQSTATAITLVHVARQLTGHVLEYVLVVGSCVSLTGNRLISHPVPISGTLGACEKDASTLAVVTH